ARASGKGGVVFFGNRSQLREITACDFSNSSGHDALISDEMTLVTYSSNGTSLMTVNPSVFLTTRNSPRNTCRSLRSQWNPMPIVTLLSAKAPYDESDGANLTSDVKRCRPAAYARPAESTKLPRNSTSTAGTASINPTDTFITVRPPFRTSRLPALPL